MFRVLQVDPETAALHLNAHALGKHGRVEQLSEVIDVFFQEGPGPTLKELASLPESADAADMVLMWSSLMHEVRHYVDLVLTPYGFHRLRTAFECYRTLPTMLVNVADLAIPIPLMSGADPVNQRLLGLENFSGSVADRYAQLLAGRWRIISADNRWLGGDSILEALAFSVQAEVAMALFPQATFKARMPYLYDDVSGGWTAFNSKYRWQYVLARVLSDQPGQWTMRLVYWMLFASLCGSIARDAKYADYDAAAGSLEELTKPGRFIDERLPGNRLDALLDYLKPRVAHDTLDRDECFREVDAACEKLFGYTLADEITADIESDERLLRELRQREDASASASSASVSPLGPFAELVARRREFLALFEEDPERAVSPVELIRMMTPERLPDVIFEFLHGVDRQDLTDGWTVVVERHWRSLDDEDSEAVYSAQRHYRPVPDADRGSAWATLYGLLAPAYKILLYGHRYFSIGEPALGLAPLIRRFESQLHWDPLYLRPNNVGNADSYFDFFGLETAECDVCKEPVAKGDGRFVSGWTVRTNDKFVQTFSARFPSVIVEALLNRDWSGWLMCHHCAQELGFTA